MVDFDYYQPNSLQEVIALLSKYKDDAVLLAGGTALLVDIRQGKLQPHHMISLWNVPGLDDLNMRNGICHLGTLTTLTHLANTFTGQPALLGLVDCVLTFGSRQIQNVATVGGNICKASPGADMVLPLLCLDAQVHLSGPSGSRETPLDGFLVGPGKSALQPAEVLTGISFAIPAPRTGTAFLKAMRRKAVDLSQIAVATRVTLAEDGETILEPRISLGAVAPYPMRAKHAEAILNGSKFNSDLLHQAAVEACNEIHPIDDVRASAEYRIMLTEIMVQRAVIKAVERSREGA